MATLKQIEEGIVKLDSLLEGEQDPEKRQEYLDDIATLAKARGELKTPEKTETDPVHAAANFTHGDNTPNFADTKLGYEEMKRIGTIIGKQAFNLFKSLDSGLSDSVNVLFRAREIDVYKNNSINNISICPKPVVGMALTGGATRRINSPDGRPS